MAIVVNSNANHAQYNNLATTQTLAFSGSSAGVGESVFCLIASDTNVTFTVATLSGVGLTANEDSGSAGTPRCFIYSLDNLGQTEASIKITPSASAKWDAWILNVAGLLTTGSFDVGNAVHQTSTSESISSPTTNFANELVLAVCANTRPSAPGTATGFTQIVTAGTATAYDSEADYKIVSATGVQTATWATIVNNNIGMCIATYQAAPPAMLTTGPKVISQAVNRAAYY